MKKPKKNKKTVRLKDPLGRLLAMPLEDRIKAVAKDVKSGEDKFAEISAHDLADALEVPESRCPTEGWGFVSYAERQTIEQYAECRLPVSEFVYLLEDKVNHCRFEELKEKFEKYEQGELTTFGFLKKAERKIIEQSLDEEELKGNQDNGICCMASHCVQQDGIELCFEGDIEDDGHCISLRTPYDKRDGHFMDMDGYITG